MSFRARIAATAAGAVAVAVLIVSVAAYAASARSLRAEVDRSLEEAAAELRSAREPRVIGIIEFSDDLIGAFFENDRLFEEFRNRAQRNVFGPLPSGQLGGATGFAQVVDARGRLISLGGDLTVPADYQSLPVSRAAQEIAAGAAGGPHFETVELQESSVRILTEELSPGLAIQVARPLDEVSDSLNQLAVTLGVGSIAGVALAALLGLLVAKLAMRPVTELTSTAERVAATRDLTHRIDHDSSDELGRLSSSFNTMLEALNESEDARRQLVADASHELRTPLTSLRTNIELLADVEQLTDEDRRRLVADVVEQLDELNFLISDLVDAAREEEPVEMLVPVQLEKLVSEAVERARRNHPAVVFELDAAPCSVRGVPRRLERAIGNLLDNAVKWSPPGGSVEVTVADCAITVRDHGLGVAEEDLPHVFDRFYRSAEARGLPGSGLGLAIVDQVATTHGGETSVRNHPDGGAEFRMTLRSSSDSQVAFISPSASYETVDGTAEKEH